MKYLPNFHPNKDKVQISYYLVLVSPASKQFWGELRKRFFFFFCYSESLLWSWQWKSQNVSKLSLVFTISWNNNVKCNTKSMVIKHQKFFSLLDVIIYVWCMEKKCFSKLASPTVFWNILKLWMQPLLYHGNLILPLQDTLKNEKYCWKCFGKHKRYAEC